jgi:hypothetical protein
MERILDDLMASDIQNGSLLELPKDFDPLADVNKRVIDYHVLEGFVSRIELTVWVVRLFRIMLSLLFKHDNVVLPIVDVKNECHSTGLMKPMSSTASFSTTAKCSKFDRRIKNIHTSKNNSGRDEVQLDDGLKLMTADDYLSLRMLPMVAELSKKTPRLSSWSSTFTICVLVLSVSAAALSTFDRSDFVPAALALSGGITAWASYQQTDLRLVLTNNSLSQLNQLLVWWDGLTMIEKRIPINKETLVKSSELAIISQATVVGGSSSSPNLETKDDGEDDGKK